MSFDIYLGRQISKTWSGREAAAILISSGSYIFKIHIAPRFFHVIFFGVVLRIKEFDDRDVWDEYKKNVSRLKDHNRVNLFEEYLSKIVPSKIIERKIGFNEKYYDLNDGFKFPKGSFIISEMNRKERRKFRSESTIDLHGFSRDIDSVLNNFCAKCIMLGVRNITVISGKGEGIVKSSVYNWIKNSSNFIISFFEIKDSRGESGAFAIKLRSNK